MIRCTLVAATVLLCFGCCEASRDEIAERRGALGVDNKEASTATVNSTEARAASIAVGSKATLRHTAREVQAHGPPADKRSDIDSGNLADIDSGNLASNNATSSELSALKSDEETNSGAFSANNLASEWGSASDSASEASGSEKSFSENPSGSVSEDASAAPREDDAAGESASEEEDKKDEPTLCTVSPDMDSTTALTQIENCVKQLEQIKEGTLKSGEKSWNQNNAYVKGLAGLQNRMTELARPEPFEIAFATDQADMYNKLKERLQAIQLDLPKLKGTK